MTQAHRHVGLWGSENPKVLDLELLSPVPDEVPPVERDQLTLDLVIDLSSFEPVVEIRHRLQTAPRWKLAVKRGIDFVVGSVILILVSPLMLVTALAIKVTSRGPVFFGQDRVGYMGEKFRFLKFRSMCHDAEERKVEVLGQNHHQSGPIFKIRNDPRMTPVGKVIRRFSIDELPQILHVIQGTMSLVGPRPLPYEDVVAQIPEDHLHNQSMYTTWDLHRLTTKPGITCIWQVSGRSELDYDTWVRMDIDYIENWSLWLDAKLLAQTIPAVLSGRGAY